MSLSSIRTYLSKGNRATWCVFVLFVTMIFIKCVLFHWWYFNTIMLSSLWKAPLDALIFYLPKIVVALLLGSFIFLCKHHWWTIILMILIDLWCIANLMYNNANDLLLDVPAILMATNLKGFESSLNAFFHVSYLILPLLTILYVFIVYIMGCSKKRIPIIFAIIFLLQVFVNICFCIPTWLNYYQNKVDADFDMANGREIIIQLYGKNGWRCFVPFHEVKMDALPDLTYYPDYGPYYVYQNSIIHYAGAMIIYHINSQQQLNIEIQPEELQGCFSPNSILSHNPQQNLIIILVESMESWPFQMGKLSWKVAPNLMDFFNQQHITKWTTIRSEAKHGVSGDGQMLVSSGMLPIKAGAACILHGNNIWPSFIGLFPHSAFIDISNGVWNQRTMCQQYGYKSDIYSLDGHWDDKEIFEQLNNVVDTIEEPFIAFALTGAMHSPFTRHHGYQLNIQDGMPQFMKDYLECLHYTDSCFGIFWDKYKHQIALKNTHIVITGDHTVFKPAMLKDFHSYALRHDINISAEESFCPLIIYSPSIQGNIQVTDTCYQMDIYPTIMHLIGCEDYYWKGFGVNLLDSTARHNRPITEQEAYRLSDLMIRSNYFRQYHPQ